MEWWAAIRHRVLVEGVSKRQVLTDTGIHWQTLQKILAHSEPPGYRSTKGRRKPKLGPYLERIRQIIAEDKYVPRKQRHTARRIFERIRGEGYQGGYTQVKAAVRGIRQRSQEVFVPLVHRPGEAQVDFGYALVRLAGVPLKVALFVMVLPYSDAFFVQVFARECTEVYWEAHRRAFQYFGGVPTRITYDNTSILVRRIIKSGKQQVTDALLKLKSHYLFDHHFCNLGRGNEKGVVEGIVKYARLNFLVPVPVVRSLAELNEQLAQACRQDLARRLRGRAAPKGELLKEDQAAFRPLPVAPFAACRQLSTIASSLSLVRFDRNDYSVPVRYAHHPVVVKGYVDEVEVCCQDTAVARHARLWDKAEVSFEPLHYLALLEHKPGALDHARPLADWQLPECFLVLRRRLEAQADGAGTREYIRVLRLLEKHPLRALTRAVTRGLGCGAITRDAIAQFLIPQEDWRATTFRLDGREHLRQVKVSTADIRAYQSLLTGGTP